MTRHNDEVFVHVELIDVRSGTQLWGAQFRGDLSISSPVRKNSRIAFVVSCDQFWRPPRALSKKSEANVLRDRIVFIA